MAPFHIASLLPEMVRMLYIFPERSCKQGKIWSPDITSLTFTVFCLFFELVVDIQYQKYNIKSLFPSSFREIMFQPKCSSQIKKMEYYLATNKNENAICSNMDEPRGYPTKWRKSERENQIFYDIIYKWNLKRSTNELIYKIETKSQTKKINLWFPKFWGGINWEFGIQRCILP